MAWVCATLPGMLRAIVRAALGFVNGVAEASVPDSNDGQLVTDGDRVLWTRAKIAATINELDDITVATVATALGSLAAGPTGIMLTAHPSNTVTIRIGNAPTSTKGIPLAARQSIILSVANASALKACTESSTATLCVSAV